jgi:hypothetical protein
VHEAGGHDRAARVEHGVRRFDEGRDERRRRERERVARQQRSREGEADGVRRLAFAVSVRENSARGTEVDGERHTLHGEQDEFRRRDHRDGFGRDERGARARLRRLRHDDAQPQAEVGVAQVQQGSERRQHERREHATRDDHDERRARVRRRHGAVALCGDEQRRQTAARQTECDEAGRTSVDERQRTSQPLSECEQHPEHERRDEHDGARRGEFVEAHFQADEAEAERQRRFVAARRGAAPCVEQCADERSEAHGEERPRCVGRAHRAGECEGCGEPRSGRAKSADQTHAAASKGGRACDRRCVGTHVPPPSGARRRPSMHPPNSSTPTSHVAKTPSTKAHHVRRGSAPRRRNETTGNAARRRAMRVCMVIGSRLGSWVVAAQEPPTDHRRDAPLSMGGGVAGGETSSGRLDPLTTARAADADAPPRRAHGADEGDARERRVLEVEPDADGHGSARWCAHDRPTSMRSTSEVGPRRA